MKFISYYYNNKENVGILTENGIIHLEKYNSMIDLIENFNEEILKNLKILFIKMIIIIFH